MAGQHEVICTEAPIPEGIIGGDNIEVVDDGLPYGSKVVRVSHVHELDHHCYTEGQEEDVRSLRISGPELIAYFHHVNEIPFHGVDALAGTIMEHGRLPFFIHENLELFFHFQVTPAKDNHRD